MRAPASTYRVQLTPDEGFDHACRRIDHIADLGFDALYLSPIFAARPGSEHGYDVVDSTRISDQLGGEDAFRALAEAAHERGLSIILDIVPNHQAIGPENPAWMDVLAHGPASSFAGWFDIAWERAEDGSPTEAGIAVPVLGGSLDDVLSNGELTLTRAGSALQFTYYEWTFPLDVRSEGNVLERAAAHCSSAQQAAHLRAMADHARAAPSWQEESPGRAARRRQCAGSIHDALSTLLDDPVVAAAVDRAIEAFNKSPTPPGDGRLSDSGEVITLADLLAGQPYRLEMWRTAMRDLSYRRFFDITHLIGVRVEDPAVFDATHAKVLDLVEHGLIDGVRIDHIDGLAEPGPYLRRLRNALAERRTDRNDCYVLVEKILEGDEPLPEDWPVAGTTGYDWLNAAGGVFVDRAGVDALSVHQRDVLGGPADFHMLVVDQKARLATELFGGEVESLHEGLARLTADHPGPTVQTDDLRAAIIAVSAAVAVYRTYITRDDVLAARRGERDAQVIERAIDEAKIGRHSLDTPALAALSDVLLGRWPTRDDPVDLRRAAADWIIAWQQFTGPLTAKGLEDTALYRDVRLISLNEVGVDAERLERPSGVAGLHEHNARLRSTWPMTMTATSTHDTKRSEDARARLHVLSECADEWTAAADRWREMNEPHRSRVDDGPAPRPPMEHLIYQSILAVWPLNGARDVDPSFVDRIMGYTIKAGRESKRRTSWIDADDDYERALEQFVRAILDPDRAPAFIADVDAWAARLSWSGMLNSLSQAVLKIASPGVPDVYRGCEAWDFSLVDPDNRRPVDWDGLDALRTLLPDPQAGDVSERVATLLSQWRSGAVKLHVTRAAMRARCAHRDIFLYGAYEPLAVQGPRSDHLCAFYRRHGEQRILALAGRLFTALADTEHPPVARAVWGDTAVALPPDAPGRWRDVLTGRTVQATESRLVAADALTTLPTALLVADEPRA